MILGKNVGSVFSEGREIKKVYSLGKLVWEKTTDDPVIDYSTTPLTIKALDTTVKVKFNEGKLPNYKYSINGGEWIVGDTYKINLKANDILTICGNDIYKCYIEGLSDVYGNIMSVMYGDNFIGKKELLYSLAGFFNLLYSEFNNTSASYGSDIRNAKDLILPATTLTKGCYKYMLSGCKSLTTAPELPAIILAEDCYCGMFAQSALTDAPVLPATTLAPYCYDQMFYGCKSLTIAPELPATTLAKLCYGSMFEYCINLTTAELPATTLAEGCYQVMFYGCENLNYIKCYAKSNIEYYNIRNWTTDVSPTGTLVCYKSSEGVLKNYIPDTWTIEYID